MQFSDTTNKNGLIQECEFWTNLGDGGISGNSTLLKVFTNRINRRYEKALAKLNLGSDRGQVDDTNYDNQPFSTFDILSGQADYQFLTDEDGDSITDITAVMILESASATQYVTLERITLDDKQAEEFMSHNSENTGVPTGFIERNNTIFFDKLPNYSATAGGKLFFRRVPSYFASTDTTKKPGYNADYHQLLALGASYDWLLVNKGENATLITRVEAELAKQESDFFAYAQMRSPVRNKLAAAVHNTR